MLVLNAKADWSLKYDNAPRLQILVDKFPERKELLYNEKNGIYYAEKDGYVLFCFYEKPGQGYGGYHFELNMQNGEKKTLIGPWSSRSGCVNAVGFGPCVDVHLTDNAKDFEKGHFLSGHVTLDLAFQAIKLSKCNLLLEVETKTYSSKILSGEQNHIFGKETLKYHFLNENCPKELIQEFLKDASEATFYPFLSEKCVCSVCKCIRIGDRLVKHGYPCRASCAKKEDYDRFFKQVEGY